MVISGKHAKKSRQCSECEVITVLHGLRSENCGRKTRMHVGLHCGFECSNPTYPSLMPVVKVLNCPSMGTRQLTRIFLLFFTLLVSGYRVLFVYSVHRCGRTAVGTRLWVCAYCRSLAKLWSVHFWAGQYAGASRRLNWLELFSGAVGMGSWGLSGWRLRVPPTSLGGRGTGDTPHLPSKCTLGCFFGACLPCIRSAVPEGPQKQIDGPPRTFAKSQTHPPFLQM
jgi:hypothetical protein